MFNAILCTNAQTLAPMHRFQLFSALLLKSQWKMEMMPSDLSSVTGLLQVTLHLRITNYSRCTSHNHSYLNAHIRTTFTRFLFVCLLSLLIFAPEIIYLSVIQKSREDFRCWTHSQNLCHSNVFFRLFYAFVEKRTHLLDNTI